jgi:hypothetical protein
MSSKKFLNHLSVYKVEEAYRISKANLSFFDAILTVFRECHEGNLQANGKATLISDNSSLVLHYYKRKIFIFEKVRSLKNIRMDLLYQEKSCQKELS